MDAVIAQGWEAGGHGRSHTPTEPYDGVGTMALVPQVLDAISLPVIAAGGIGDGRGIAAAVALGASGVQLGTAFLRCEEVATEAARRKQIANAKDTDTMVTDANSRAVSSGYTIPIFRGVGTRQVATSRFSADVCAKWSDKERCLCC